MLGVEDLGSGSFMMERATGSDQLTLRVMLRKTVIHLQKIIIK